MTGRLPINDSDLHAFVDGGLEGVRRAEVEAAIAADGALGEQVRLYRADKAMLKQLYAPLAARPVPKEWLDLARGEPVKSWRRQAWRPLAAIAAVLLMAVVGVTSYRQLEPAREGEIVAAALDAREHALPGENIVQVSAGDTHRYDGALKTAVAMNVKVPDLGRMGYKLAGLHVYAGSAQGRAVELLYKGAQGRLFTLYVRHSDGAARFDQFEQRGLRVCVWQDEELGMVMAGNVSTASMQRLASLAYTGLTL